MVKPVVGWSSCRVDGGDGGGELVDGSVDDARFISVAEAIVLTSTGYLIAKSA